MNSEQRKELIRSHIYGLTVVEMSEIYGISVDEITHALADHAGDIEDEREYREMLAPKTPFATAIVGRPQTGAAKTFKFSFNAFLLFGASKG